MSAFNHTFLNKEEDSMKILKAVASIIPMCNLHVIVFMKDYTEMFYMVF
jgi:hypothetical protein